MYYVAESAGMRSETVRKVHKNKMLFLVSFHKVLSKAGTRYCVGLKALIYKALRGLQKGYKFDTALAPP